MGKTITTDTRTGAFVIALLAIVSTLATAHLWHLVTFIIYQCRANGRPRDALFRQQQAILRTLPTPGALIADYLKLFWHWRKKEGLWAALARISFLILLASVFVAMTWATSIFSSFIVDTSLLHVLVDSPYCGSVNITFDTLNDIGLSYVTQIVTAAEPYADDCYLNENSTQPAFCDGRKYLYLNIMISEPPVATLLCRKLFPCSSVLIVLVVIRPKTLFTTENTTCPWDPTMCAGGEKPAIRIDSGLHDLNEFGLNLAAQDRVQYRKSTTCAVLPLENHTTIINATEYSELNRAPLPQEELLALFYGDVLYSDVWKNASFIWSLSASNTTTRFDSR